MSNVGKRRPKPPLDVRQDASSGVVLLVALAVPSAVVYYFRFRAFKRDGTTTEPSQVVAFLVK